MEARTLLVAVACVGMSVLLAGCGPVNPEKPGDCWPGITPCHVLDCCETARGGDCEKACPYGSMHQTTYCPSSGIMCKQDMLPVPKCAGSVIPPKGGTCKQPTDTNKHFGTCVMVDGREDLPRVSRNKMYEVSYLRKTVKGATPQQHAIARDHGLFHSVVLIQEACTSQRETFYIEFGAVNFCPNVVIPDVIGGSLTWNNSAYIGWYKAYNKSDWQINSNVFLGGDVRGSVVNAWLDDIPKWFRNHPHYQMWSAFKDPANDGWSSTQVYNDAQCHEFTEWSIQTLYDKGANFRTNQAICRNYANVYTAMPAPETVNMRDPNAMKAVYTFYASLGEHLQEMQVDQKKGEASFEQWVEYNPTWYVVDPTNKNYFKIPMTYPYLGGKGQLMPMKLTWQNREVFGDGACLPLGPGLEFASGTAFGGLQAAEQTFI